MPQKKEYRVLFLTRQYAPIPKVCEICVKRVREGLYKKGIKSDVLQFTGEEGIVEELPVGKVYSVGAGEGRLNTTVTRRVVHFFKKASVAYRWPLYYSYAMNQSYKNQIKELEKQNHYDAIIGMALPFDTVRAGIGIDNFILYELDALSNNPQNSGFVKGLLKGRVNRLELEIFEAASLIIHMECNRSYFNKPKYEKYKDKSVFADIPNLLPFPQEDVPKGNDKIICAYFGTLLKDIRNPSYLLQLLEAIKKDTDITCEFYSRGNCEDMLEEAEKRDSSLIKPKGYVTQEFVKEGQNRADILLSIGNKLTGEDRSLPSKIFEYISVGKPIIHIYGGANDSAISYLERYGLACIINPLDEFQSNVKKLTEFISSSYGKRKNFEDIKDLFYHNSPDYTVDIIINYLEGT